MSSPLSEIYNFIQISDAVATAGQPTPAQFPDIHAAGYRVVINLALPNSTNAIPDEQTLVESQGMEYVHIPVIWEEPTLVDLDRFFQVMDQNQGNPVFVHCAMNMRVSAFIYLYRVVRQGLDLEVAQQDLQQIWTPNPVWQAFIDRALQHYLQEKQ
jgi:protein tyrosine phosphatase (PTP) superfamily phosphohydrolase (DUF442 family)